MGSGRIGMWKFPLCPEIAQNPLQEVFTKSFQFCWLISLAEMLFHACLKFSMSFKVQQRSNSLFAAFPNSQLK